MPQSEGNIQRAIQLAASSLKARLFRNNVGLFKTKDNRKVRTGLCVGSSDLIGWTKIEVTPDMVGTELAVFTALEVKTPTGKATEEQLNFITAVRDSGGIAAVVRSAAELHEVLRHQKTEGKDDADEI